MAHTPGPWEWVEDKFNGGYCGIVGKGGAEVLFPNHRNDGDEGDAWFEDFPSEANARLIAAAPDLLEACKLAVRNILDLKEGLNLMPENAVEIILTAIAKAEGRDNNG